jgi:hypothetical protein
MDSQTFILAHATARQRAKEDENNFCSLFGLGAWWADRPWRTRI